MSYIDKNLLPDERILFRTKKHPIIYLFPFILTVLSALTTPHMLDDQFLVNVVWAPWILTLFFWINAWLEYVTSDFVVTNKRVMMREGFIYRHTNEMRLAAISQVNVYQSLLGQFLNYGVVTINAFGAFDAYSMIAKPVKFQRHVNSELDKLSR